MQIRFRVPLRHPFYHDWAATPARSATGRCNVVSGTFAELAAAAARGVRADRAVFALQYPDSPFISDYERNVLWEIFGVPAFAMLLDGDGHLAAFECEAQEGMHVGTKSAETVDRELIYQGDDSVLGYKVPWGKVKLETAACDCGRPGQRLLKKVAAPVNAVEEPVAVPA